MYARRGGFRQNSRGRSWSVYFVWKAGILICGGIERMGASIVKGSRAVRSSRSHACILHCIMDASLACERSVRHRGKSSPRLAPGTLFLLKIWDMRRLALQGYFITRWLCHAIYRDGTVAPRREMEEGTMQSFRYQSGRNLVDINATAPR